MARDRCRKTSEIGVVEDTEPEKILGEVPLAEQWPLREPLFFRERTAAEQATE